MNPQGFYRDRKTYALLVAPILILIFLFFYLPVGLAFFWSFFLEQPFGGGSEFVGLQNFSRVLSDEEFWQAMKRTLMFMIVAPGLAILISLALALAADRGLRGSQFARNVIIWPKAVAGASIGVVFVFIFNPYLGIFGTLNEWYPGIWNPGIDGTDAFITVVIAQVWNGVPFNFIILLSGLQSIPDSLTKAAVLDGADPWQRIKDIQLPLLTPQLFLTFVLEFVGTVVEAFGLIDTMTEGGPGGATTLLIYKIYIDGFKAYDLSGASTQTVILITFVAIMVLFQFRLEKHVKYER
ncbi:putative SN-glycerol-3-phosphate transport system permease protein [Vibrio nigripulchritudo MADA3029]|uniref:carbohydrate ABC transporter permease n=1 Tax=Vibrio nigripulchritudo TaxID=28173 RepID=UPI0003B214C1|nr:sugar ABC transporter permease [Vibrio nigripulchritudo]CCN50706.1 putative SN-glycerol-3-phosphate transport system permease protein [Vibrio nigripulchritudo MADA3020]CCN52277.1 putative SN-glycerol-3-phosphate transport system permease protein [Vibrio nigripulchritudo MADA3021]CCN59161.1 putative SN-glycerol-3-phosphate transport system permease protein [Vibrio nigripulchritudo MADA3029]